MKRSVVLLGLITAILVLSELLIVNVAASPTPEFYEKTLILNSNQLVNNATYVCNRFKPSSIAYCNDTGYIYVTSSYQDEVLVLNPTDYLIVSTIMVGQDPTYVSAANGMLYVSNNGSGTISVINAKQGLVVSTIHVGGNPFIVVADPDNGYLYVGEKGSIIVVDQKSTIASIPLTNAPTSMVLNPVTGDVIVATPSYIIEMSGTKVALNKSTPWDYIYSVSVNTKDGEVYALTENTSNGATNYYLAVLNLTSLGFEKIVCLTYPLTNGSSIAYDEYNGDVYFTIGLKALFTFNTTTLKVSMAVLFPTAIVSLSGVVVNPSIIVNPSNGQLYLLSLPSTVFIIYPNNGSYIGIGIDVFDSSGIYDKVTNELYIVNENSNTLYVVSPTTDKVVKVLPTVPAPQALACDPNNGYIYVAAGSSYPCLVEEDPNNGEVVKDISLAYSASDLIYDPVKGLLYALEPCGGQVAVINPNNGSVIGTLHVGDEPYPGDYSMAYDPQNGYVYVAFFPSNTITEIDGSKVVSTIKLNFHPTTMAVIDGLLYVGLVSYNGFFYGHPHLAIINTSNDQVIKNVSLQYSPVSIGYYKGYLYLVEPGILCIMNPNDYKNVSSLPLGLYPTLVGCSEGQVFIANENQGTVTIISAQGIPQESSSIPATETYTNTTTVPNTSTPTTTQTSTSTTTTSTTTVNHTSTTTSRVTSTSTVESTSTPTTTHNNKAAPLAVSPYIVLAVVVVLVIVIVVLILARKK
ncbi:YncE family protein [Stygiolobus caldivivus]|nr:YncE family protein [Stygiolobus caldivivus]